MHSDLFVLRDSAAKHSPLPGKKPGQELTPWSPSHRLHFPAQRVAAGTPGEEGEWDTSRSISISIYLIREQGFTHLFSLIFTEEVGQIILQVLISWMRILAERPTMFS